jgi:hypothetical protein
MRTKLSKVVIRLIVADFFMQSGWGLISPIFAIFITQQICGGTIETVAFAVATYWIVKSTIQPFLANVLDVIRGERDDFKALIFGMYAAAMVPFGYFFATQSWHIFVLEFARGAAMACVIPAWYGIFTRHINKGWEAFSWSVQSTGVGFAAGFAAAFGGIIASLLGFQSLFVLVGLLKIVSATIYLSIFKNICPEDKVLSFKK